MEIELLDDPAPLNTVPLKDVEPVMPYRLRVVSGPVQIMANEEAMPPFVPAQLAWPILVGRFKLPVVRTTTSPPDAKMLYVRTALACPWSNSRPAGTASKGVIRLKVLDS